MGLKIVLFCVILSSVYQDYGQRVQAFLPSSTTHPKRTRHVAISSKPRSRRQCCTPIASSTSWKVLKMSETEQQMSIEKVSAELMDVKRAFDQKMADATTLAEAEAIRREYMGKKGPINEAMGYMRLLSNEDKPKLGAVVNEIKSALEEVVTERLAALQVAEIEAKMADEMIDVTLPGVSRMADIGRRHPLSMTMEKAVDIFTRLGYDTVTSCADSPEIETDYYCFQALNCPKDHPARDMQDTFYLTEDMEYMLRTHTSAVQIRQLEKRKPPLRIVAPGRVYRRDDIDATHSLMFHQVEILAIEKRGELNLGHLKGTVEYFLKNMLGPDIKIRFRGSYFPFTEPSMEVDVYFRGRWLEVLGCGMVDPNVLEMAGIDPEEYTGFAAGFGVERFAMVIHQIGDLREFFKNDKRFLQQFPHFYDDGLVSFLEGKAQEPKIDYRGTTPPDPPVDSMEELKSRLQQQQVGSSENISTVVNGNHGSSVVTDANGINSNVKANDAAVSSASTVSTGTSDVDISKLDIRVGVITKAWEHPDAEKLFCEEIDIGEGQPRCIASGLRAHYKVDDLVGQRVLVLSNLKPRKLVGFESHGMVLCASDAISGQVQFVEPPDDAVIGERIIVSGYEGDPATENQIGKKKMLETIFPDLRTNADGTATYKGIPLTTSAGPCKPSIPNGSVS